MINIVDKSKCCGCGACEQICPAECLSMEPDNEGFLYPRINKDLCISCDLCDEVCSFTKNNSDINPIGVFSGINKDERVRIKSSSGGLFTLLAEKVISKGGVVFGARFNEKWKVIHDYANNNSAIEKFLGAKYSQSEIRNNYVIAEKFLKEGRYVLFSGTPCQIAGLNSFLRDSYENLLSVEVACHGVPSPKVFEKYLKSFSDNIVSVNLRYGEESWKDYKIKIGYINKDRQEYVEHHDRDKYMNAFLSEISLRPSCYNCRVKLGKSGCDLMLGDFWNVSNVMPEIDDDKGISVALAYTKKGLEFISNIDADLKNISFEDACGCNGGFNEIVHEHPNRELFFNSIDETDSLISLIDRCCNTLPFKYRIKRKAKHLLNKLNK